jgi:DNA-binding response OmpR family regulator
MAKAGVGPPERGAGPARFGGVVQVLIIEDDDRIRPLLMRSLDQRGYAVDSAVTGMQGLQLAIDTRPDLVILDLGLPDVDGTQVLSMLRAVSQVPVIVASARDDDPSLVGCLNAGADDYVVKPYTTAQLEARIRAVLRRTAGGRTPRQRLVVGGLELDAAARRTTLDGQPVELSPREFDLLRHLAERAGEVVTKKELLAEVWQQAWGGSDKTVDVHLSWLRKKLGETAAEPRYLHSVRGVGIRLAAPEG